MKSTPPSGFSSIAPRLFALAGALGLGGYLTSLGVLLAKDPPGWWVLVVAAHAIALVVTLLAIWAGGPLWARLGRRRTGEARRIDALTAPAFLILLALPLYPHFLSIDWPLAVAGAGALAWIAAKILHAGRLEPFVDRMAAALFGSVLPAALMLLAGAALDAAALQRLARVHDAEGVFEAELELPARVRSSFRIAPHGYLDLALSWPEGVDPTYARGKVSVRGRYRHSEVVFRGELGRLQPRSVAKVDLSNRAGEVVSVTLDLDGGTAPGPSTAFLERLTVRDQGPNELKASLRPADPPRIETSNPVEAKKVQLDEETRNGILAFAPHRFGIELPAVDPEAAVFDAVAPGGGKIRFGYGILEEAWFRTGDGVRFEVHLIPTDGEPEQLFVADIDPKHHPGDRRWHDAELHLPRRALGGRLVFETHPGPALEAPFARPADAAYDYAAWSQPRYIPPIYGDSASGDSTQQRPNLLLISIDTLRADHLGTYGYGRDTSPNIDALAAKGVVFEKAIAQAPWTTPSHMSLLTSLWPSTHGVVSTREALAPSIPTLASVLRQEGYGTAAFCGGVTMSGQRGFDHGFDRYRETFTFLDDDETRGVWRWLDERSGEPFFLFLHTFEVHAPYTHPHFVEGEAAQRELAPLLSGVLGQESIQESQRLKRGLQGAGLFDREITEALYDGGIRYTDAWVGEVLAALDARGLRKNTLVVLTSDHGDEFGEHDPLAIYDAHGHSLYDELLHIPWIMAFEGRLPAERRVAEQVRSIDVMPTVLELMGLPEQSGLQGTSLAAPLLSDEPIPSLVAFSEVSGSSPKSGQDLRSMRTQELKYIAVRRWLGDQVETDEELFDLLRDVGELHDLADLEGAVVEDLRRLSEAFFADAERAKVEGGTSLPADDETLRQLRALGYVQ